MGVSSEYNLAVCWSPGRGAFKPPFPGGSFCFLHGVYHGDGSLSPSRLGCGVLFSESSGLWSLCYFVFVFFYVLLVLWQEVLPEASGGVFLFFVLSRWWSVFVPKLFQLLMLDLRFSIDFLETRATQMGSPSSSCSAAVCSGCRDHRWPSFLFDRRVEVSFRRFFAVQRRRSGTGWLIWWLAVLGEARVVHAPVSGEDSVPLWRFWIVFYARCVCVFSCF